MIYELFKNLISSHLEMSVITVQIKDCRILIKCVSLSHKKIVICIGGKDSVMSTL